MQINQHWQGLDPDTRGASVAMGNFDGVHLGHQSVIDLARPHGPLGIVTFEPHPREYFAPHAAPFRLMNAEADDIHLPVNLGNPGEFTMNQLAEQVGIITGKEIRIKHYDLPQDDPKQRRPNIERAQSLLGWSPTVPLAEGLKKTVEYFASVVKVN